MAIMQYFIHDLQIGFNIEFEVVECLDNMHAKINQ